MSIKDSYVSIIKKLPAVTSPTKRLSFNDKMKWTGIILIIYFAMTQIIVYGVQQESVPQLQFLEIVLGSAFGSFVTLGIGPIVTASIILQLLVGSKIIPWDTQTPEGKQLFTGTQKILAILFALIEGFIFVSFGAVPAVPGGELIVIAQLALGGWVILFMDEVVSKWGIGSGISLFIAAGVSKSIIQGLFSPITQSGSFFNEVEAPVGYVLRTGLAIGGGELTSALLSIIPIIATLLVIFLSIWGNSIKVEVPLAYGSLSGFGRRWPLKFFYTSNMPVILIAALLANMQLVGRVAADKGLSWLATFDAASNSITGGILYYLYPPSVGTPAGTTFAIMLTLIGVLFLVGVLVTSILRKNDKRILVGFAIIGAIIGFLIINHPALSGLTVFNPIDIVRFFTYTIFMIGGAVIFSVFWVQTSGMDSRSVAEQIESVGMYIPGARRDVRIIEAKLKNYIPPLTILGGAAVGFLAAFADFTGAIGTGTGILLSTMIIYQFYETITQEHADDMHPALKKILGKN